MKEITEAEMLRKMAAYCAASEHCAEEVRKKIDAAGLPGDAAGRIIARLKEEKFIDEARYAHSFTNDKFRFNKWGRVKIAYELQRKNIPEAFINEALASIDEAEYRATLLDLLRGKLKSTKYKDGRDLYAKLSRFAASRGFEGATTYACLRDLVNSTTDEPDDAALE